MEKLRVQLTVNVIKRDWESKKHIKNIKIKARV